MLGLWQCMTLQKCFGHYASLWIVDEITFIGLDVIKNSLQGQSITNRPPIFPQKRSNLMDFYCNTFV